MALKCNSCRKIIHDEEKVKQILEDAKTWRQQWTLEVIKQKHGVAPCTSIGCYGEFYQT